MRASPPAEADDVRSDAALGVVTALRSFDPRHGCALRTHVYGRVVYSIRDGLRRRGRITNNGHRRPDVLSRAHPLDELAAGLERDRRLADPVDDVEELLDRLVADQRRRWLRAALRGLGDRQRAVVEGVLAGRTHAELADELGVTKSTVSSTVTHATAALRRQAESDGLLPAERTTPQ